MVRIVAELQTGERWAALWDGLARLGELGNRETEIVAGAARQGIHQNFEREQSPEGVPWHPLAPQTQRERRAGIDHRGIPFRVGGQHPILQRTRDLMLSLIDRGHSRNVTQVEVAGGSTAIVLGAKDDPQTPERIAKLHAGGLTASGRVIPARPFVGLSDAALLQVENQTRAILRQRLERVGK